MKRLLSLMLCIAMLLPLVISGCSVGGTLTLMIYMVGSDLESKHMAASNDINEILDSSLNVSRVNLLIYTGGSEMWYVDVPNDANATYILKEEDGEKYLELLETSDELHSMGEADTLSSFLNYSYENYSADHYGLILWDHGNGPLVGFGKDSLFSGDSMELSEMQQAFADSPFNETKLDFIGFDACYMSSLEVAETLSPYSSYMIASQETEPGDGWNYSFLDTFNSSFESETIAESIISSYHDYYEEKKSTTFNPDLTLACLDLTKMDELIEAFNSYFDEMKSSLDGGGYQSLSVQRSNMKSFGESPSSRGWSLDMVDLGNLIALGGEDYEEQATALETALDSFVKINQANVSDACGISLYYPYDGLRTYAQLGSEKYKSFDRSASYVSYMDTYVRTWSEGWLKSDNTVEENYDSVDESETIKDEDKLTVKLTDDQKKNFSKAYLNIYYNEPDDDREFYTPTLYMKQVAPDENGNITVNADAKIPTFNGKTFFALREVAKEKDRTTYKSMFSAVSCEVRAPEDFVTMYCYVPDDSDDIIITSIDYDNEEDGADDRSIPTRSGKSTLNGERWEYLCHWIHGGEPKRNGEGVLLPFDQWPQSGSSFYCTIIDSSLQLKMASIHQLDNYKASDFYYQIVLEDVYGNRSVTELENFPEKPVESETYEEKTDKGTMTYTLYDDYAKLEKYDGDDTELTIPESVKDLPVTKIKSDAFKALKNRKDPLKTLTISNPDTALTNKIIFSNTEKIVLPDGMKDIPDEAFINLSAHSEVVIPDSVESIGPQAFAGSYASFRKTLKRIDLPKNLRSIGVGAFGGVYFDEEITIDPDNAYYQVKDDMLLSKDGKTLLNYFGSDTTLTIPEGVEEIMPHAHAGDSSSKDGIILNHIEFPSTLKRIGYQAFDSDEFEELIFPDSLEEIGTCAFGVYPITYSEEDVHSVTKIHFGKNLRWIGKTILDGGLYGTLSISEDNRFFSVVDNRLTNKSGSADLSEKALSTSDNLVKNKAEYDCYLAVTKDLDLSKYIKAERAQDNGSYNGNDYCRKMDLNDEDKKKVSFDKTMKLSGKDLTLPCSFADLDLKESTNHPLPELINANKTEYVKMTPDDESYVLVGLTNNDIYSHKPQETYAYSIKAYNEGVNMPVADYSYMGLSYGSSISDVISKLGAPSSIYINGSIARIYYYEYVDVDYDILEHNSALDLKFVLNNDSGVPELDEFSIEVDTTGPKNTYALYSSLAKELDLSHYEKLGDSQKTLEYEGKSFDTDMVLTDKKPLSGFSVSDSFSIRGEKYSLPCKVSDITKLGFSPNDGEKSLSEEVEPDATGYLIMKDDEMAQLSLSYKNTDTKPAAAKDCSVTKIELNYGSSDYSLIDSEYDGISVGTPMDEVIKKLGEPVSFRISLTFLSVDLEYYDTDVSESSNNYGKDHLTVSFCYNPDTGDILLKGFTIEKII